MKINIDSDEMDTQIPFRAPEELKKELKIIAILKDVTMNDLILGYVQDGVQNDKKTLRDVELLP